MSEELAQIFAECTEAIQTGQLTIDDCLDQYPEFRAELTDLLFVALQVRTMPRIYASSEFRQQARGRLLAQLTTATNESESDQTGLYVGLAGWLASLQSFWQQLNPQTVLAGAIALYVGVFAVFLWWGLRGNADEPAEVIAQVETAPVSEESSVTGAQEDRAPSADVSDSPSTDSPTTTTTEDTSPAEVAAPNESAVVDNGNAVYIPFLAEPLMLNAQTAAVEVAQGVVELQQADGQWAVINDLTTATAGQRIRTQALSSAKITFFDGSYTTLGPESELSLDELNAQLPENGFRTIVMTQWLGESEHEVAFRGDGGSRYEVKTPEGSGIARGTKFHVFVTPDKLARYTVTEGKVDVTGQNRTVSVTAGQLTTLLIGNVPTDPFFSVSGEGEVRAIGATWTIAGQTFQTHDHTLIIGNPQVGDLVRIDGHLSADGSRVADRIVLLRRAVVNRFSLSGEVEAIGTAWTVAGQTIIVNDQTVIGAGIAVGDSVRVEGVIRADGRLRAEVITKLETAAGLPFQFSGLVQSIGNNSWTISGQTITVDDDTTIDNGIALGDVVAVRGWILEDGTWLATAIRRQADNLPTFEFTGVVQSMNPWQVAGIAFETRPWTIIAPDISVGDVVRVRGTILSDGTRVAESITLLTNIQPNTVIFIGAVTSLNPWVINGLPLVVNGNTVIVSNITVGTVVVVQAQLLPNGSWTILHIRPLYPEFGLGCLFLSSPVTAVNANTIQVKHWQGNIDRANIQGDIAVNNVVSLPLCTHWDGTIIIVSNVIVIYHPVVIIINDGGGGPLPSIPPGCKITGIGNNNPHLKCSNKGSRKGS